MGFLDGAMGFVNPVQSLCKGIVCGGIERSKVVNERHDASGAGTALTAGDGDLGDKPTTGQSAWAGRDAVFTKSDGLMLGMNSWNHENLKK